MKALAALCLLAAPAAAQPICMPHAQMIAGLENRYHEAQQGAGLGASGLLVEIYAAPGGSWSLIATDAHGRACMIGAGEGWHAVKVGEPA